jgi:hypothetical protein
LPDRFTYLWTEAHPAAFADVKVSKLTKIPKVIGFIKVVIVSPPEIHCLFAQQQAAIGPPPAYALKAVDDGNTGYDGKRKAG